MVSFMYEIIFKIYYIIYSNKFTIQYHKINIIIFAILLYLLYKLNLVHIIYPRSVNVFLIQVITSNVKLQMLNLVMI